MKIKHKGISRHRLDSNPREKVFAEEWAKIAPDSLGYMLYGQDKLAHNVTPRDATIVATVIQWLGSPVGQHFVEECQKKGDIAVESEYVK